MTNVRIEVDEHALRLLVLNYLGEMLNTELKETDVLIEVKTSKNYRTAEWEQGKFRATITKTL
jgi:hypothetical protein